MRSEHRYMIVNNEENPPLILNVLFYTIKVVNICFSILHAHTYLYANFIYCGIN